MIDYAGKVAVFTGGASGIGYALAAAMGARGARVMLADIEEAALAPAVAALRASGVEADGCVCDVASRASVQAAADATLARFGTVHVICNNAGVVVADRVDAVRAGDWRWIVDVNLMGVVHGVAVFAPLIAAHGEGGHILNTASIAGVMSIPTYEPYTATKYAVVGMSEGWARQFAPARIGVSVFCPGVVRTRISDSRRNRPTSYGEQAADLNEAGRQDVKEGLSPAVAARYVLDAMAAGELYIFTQPEFRGFVDQRRNAIAQAFAATRASPALAGLPARPVPTI